MNVLMFGWEFPPTNSGGLGTACYGLVKGLNHAKIKVTFVLPYVPSEQPDFVELVSPGNVKIEKVDSILQPYMTSGSYTAKGTMYGSTLFEEVERYAESVKKIIEQGDFDVIHCHDWMTYGAGMVAKHILKKPLVMHVHSTEYDRSGGPNINVQVYELEKEGLRAADAIIAVSDFTKNKIVEHYGIDEDKIHVVHNAVDLESDHGVIPEKRGKTVLFLGRLTIQKGPDYFLDTAKKVLEYEPNVTFIVAGTGDMESFIIEKAAELGIADKVLFAGFLDQEDVERAYKMADLYVMPSVSEPFGITTLEAIKYNTPVIISKQSGVSEVIKHCLKVDFWDVDQLANYIVAILRYAPLRESMQENALSEIENVSWDVAARKCVEIYRNLII